MPISLRVTLSPRDTESFCRLIFKKKKICKADLEEKSKTILLELEKITGQASWSSHQLPEGERWKGERESYSFSEVKKAGRFSSVNLQEAVVRSGNHWDRITRRGHAQSVRKVGLGLSSCPEKGDGKRREKRLYL